MKKLILFLSALALCGSVHAVPTHDLDETVRIAGSTVTVSNDQNTWRLHTSCDNIVADPDTVVKAPVRRIREGTRLRIVTEGDVQVCRVQEIDSYTKMVVYRSNG